MNALGFAKSAKILLMASLLAVSANAQATFLFTPEGSSEPTDAVELSGNPATDSYGTAKVNGVGGRFWYKDAGGTIWVMNQESFVEFELVDGGSQGTGVGYKSTERGTWENIDYS